jgi:site-specific recombinase XerD
MKSLQLPLFRRKTVEKVATQQTIEPVAPTAASRVVHTLPAYAAYLGSQGYSESTQDKYVTDVKQLSLFFRAKNIGEITTHDLQQWIAHLRAKHGEHLDPKTVNRKVSAMINYFAWLTSLGVMPQDPTAPTTNARVPSPLPDYLYESEIQTVYREASTDPRMYLLVLLLLETGMKSHELFALTTAHVDLSDPYRPEMWIKHRGKQAKKDRKVALPPHFLEVYHRYLVQYRIDDVLFPYTDRCIQLLFQDLKKRTSIDKELTPKTLRHTHVVRAYQRGEEPDRIFDRIGLAPDSRKEADELYRRLARRGL